MKNIENEINKTLNCLKKNEAILYPTDTVWGLGCAASSIEGIEKIKQIKQRPPDKSFIVLVHSIQLLEDYVGTIPEPVLPFLHQNNRPTTIIYPVVQNLPKSLLANDGSIGIRLVQFPFCVELIKSMGEPLVSTSANISGEPTPKTFEEISPKVKEKVDYVVDSKLFPKKEETAKPSRIIKVLEDGTVQVLRD